MDPKKNCTSNEFYKKPINVWVWTWTSATYTFAFIETVLAMFPTSSYIHESNSPRARWYAYGSDECHGSCWSKWWSIYLPHPNACWSLRSRELGESVSRCVFTRRENHIKHRVCRVPRPLPPSLRGVLDFGEFIQNAKPYWIQAKDIRRMEHGETAHMVHFHRNTGDVILSSGYKQRLLYTPAYLFKKLRMVYQHDTDLHGWIIADLDDEGKSRNLRNTGTTDSKEVFTSTLIKNFIFLIGRTVPVQNNATEGFIWLWDIHQFVVSNSSSRPIIRVGRPNDGIWITLIIGIFGSRFNGCSLEPCNDWMCLCCTKNE